MLHAIHTAIPRSMCNCVQTWYIDTHTYMLTDATSNVILCQPTKSFDRPIEGMLMGDKAVNRRSFSTQRFLFHLKKSIQCPLVCLLCKLIYSLHPTILLSVVSQVLIVRCSHLERFNNCFKCEIVVNKTKGTATSPKK